MIDLGPYRMNFKEKLKVYIHFIGCVFKNYNPFNIWPNSHLDSYKSERYDIVRCSCGYGFDYHPLACKNDDFKFRYNIPKDNLGLLQPIHVTMTQGFIGEGRGYNKEKFNE